MRRGECPPERCRGRCCESVGVWFDRTPDGLAFADVLRVRGVRIIEPAEDPTRFLAKLEQRCQYLELDGRCLLHPDMNPTPGQPSRPQFCWDWPQEPSQLIDEDCGFSFEWVDAQECVAWAV